MPAATRTFTPEDQSAFAALAGDFNPIHVDPLAARRLLFGTPVVHGVHLVLWALETSWPAQTGPARLADLEATFRQPVRAGFDAVCEWEAGPGGPVRITSQGRLAAEVRYGVEAGTADPGPAAAAWPAPERRASAVLGFAEAREVRDETALGYAPADMARRFPRLSSALPEWQLAVLLATSRVVGVHCPGLRALFTSLKLAFRHPEAAPQALRYEVVKADERLSSLRLRVAAPGIDGELGTRLRPDPVEQPSLARLAPLVERGEFAGTRALVVGGSRGLGEVAAKLVAAGGGEVRLTYQVGAVEAARVVEEIRAAGGQARAFACDVLDRRAEPRLLDGWAPNLLLYFPTPFISLNESTAFSVELFRLYCRHYVEGFAWIVEAVAAMTSGPLAVLYPSSSVLDEVLPKAAEYAAAKAAGEAACSHLSRLHAGMRCHAPRLPRVLTDRTASILAAETADAGPLLLRELRRMSAAG
jgi:NAD(P)-dependent dehydrogenase (short-subunit alcohol dehydrogenase family)